MNYLACFVLGLLVSDWLSVKLARLAVKSSSEPVREAVRNFARNRNIDLKEKGRIVKTSTYDALDAFDSAKNALDVMEALDKITNDNSDRS